jgi:hypothetical protein
MRKELAVDQHSKCAEVHFKDYSALDFRVPSDSPAVRMDCYPRGTVPNVRLGTFANGQ